MSNIFVFRRFIKALKDAARGIREAFVEQSFRTLFVIAVIVGACLFFFPLSSAERGVLVLVIVLVLSLELINSQIERVLDILRPDYDEEVRKMKDISAGAVLVASIGAVVVGTIIILPHLLAKVSHFL